MVLSTYENGETGAVVRGKVNAAITELNRISLVTAPSRYYHFHGYAADSVAGEPNFRDRSGCKNDGLFGANLSNANAWANAGYVSTIDPAGGSTDSVIRMPSINLDLLGDEKFIFWWLGKATAEGAAINIFGDGYSTTYPGIRLRMNTNGTSQMVLQDGTTSQFLGSSAAVFDGNFHSLAWVIDGATGSYMNWVDEAPNPTTLGVYATAPSILDTRTNHTFNIGTAGPKAAASTDGGVIQTRALMIMRMPPSATFPSVATFTDIFEQVRRDPTRLVLNSAL